MNLEEFGYQFGVHGAENLISKLNQIERETEELDEAAAHLGNTFQQVFDLSLRRAIPPAFIKMVMDEAMAFSKQAEYIDRLAQTSGISAKSIQQLGYALHRFGGDVSTATMQLDQLQGKLEKFWKPVNKGGGLASELAQLSKKHKVDLRGVTSSIDLLKAISVRMEKLSERKKVDLARAFGLDDSTFLMVKKGLKSVEEALYKAQKYVLFDDKEIRQAKEFEDTLRDIADNITLISKSFSFGAIPEMQKFANIMRTVTDFMTEHKEIVKGIGMTAFGAGAYGLFRLLNFIPTKFLKASAGVFGTGFAIGTVNEEIDKLDRKKKDLTFVGDLENAGFKKAAKYYEAILRAIHDLTTNKSFGGFIRLFEMIFGKPAGTFKKAVDDFSSTTEEYKDVYSHEGIKGVLALMATPRTGTLKERKEQFLKNLADIKENGVFSFIKKELGDTFAELKKTFTSTEFWTPILNNINRMIDYLQGKFTDLVIFIKQQFGIKLSKADKAHILKKQLQNTEQESANTAITAASKEIANIMNSKDDLSKKKDAISKRVMDIASQIHKNNGNSGYSEEEIAARLLFAGSKQAFNDKNPELIKNVNSWTSYIKSLGLDTLATTDQISKIYDEYKSKINQKIIGASDALKSTIDISDIIGNKKIDNVDVKNITLQDFIDKAFPLLSQDETGKALDRFKKNLSNDTLWNALTFSEKKPFSPDEFLKWLKDNSSSGIFSNISLWIKSLKGDVTDKLQPILKSRLKYHQKNLKELKKHDPDLDANYDLLDKDIDKLSFTELIKEEINAELHDIYRNYISIDKAIEHIGRLIEQSANLIEDINNIIRELKEKLQGYMRLGGTAVGISVGSKFGSYGALLGGLLGFLFGDKESLALDKSGKEKENYSYTDYAKERLKQGIELVSSSIKPDKINSLIRDLNSLQLQFYDADTDIVKDDLWNKIQKKEAELAQAQAMLNGYKNLQNMANVATANSNIPATNNNQENVVNVNQTINIGKTVSTADDIGIASMNGARTGAGDGLRQATNNRVMGNAN